MHEPLACDMHLNSVDRSDRNDSAHPSTMQQNPSDDSYS